MAAECRYSFGQSKFAVRNAAHDVVVDDLPTRLHGWRCAEIEDNFANRRMRVHELWVMTAFSISKPVRQFAE
jgi:hypothetical protein